MKSLGLALTMFLLTGTLVALDMSGMHLAAASAEPAPSVAARGLAAASNKPDQGQAEAAKEEEDEDPEPELFNAFLITQRTTSAATASANAAPATLRYD